MVRIQVKHGDDGDGDSEEKQKEFVYDCQSTSAIHEISNDVTEIANLQSKILLVQSRLSLLLNTHPKVISLIRVLSDANSYASKDQVLHDKPLSVYVLRDQVRSIEKEFMGNHHILGFPDPNMQQLLQGLEALQEDTAQLWWAGKELVRGKTLCDYIGKNEKTKEMDLTSKKAAMSFEIWIT